MKLTYLEGSAFLVPLPSGGYARGVVARTAPKGKILLGYFFGPPLDQGADPRLESLNAKDAILCVRFGDLGLIEGHWPILGDSRLGSAVNGRCRALRDVTRLES